MHFQGQHVYPMRNESGATDDLPIWDMGDLDKSGQ